MIKKILTLYLMMLTLICKSQVSMSVQLSQASIIQKEQLWNLILVNNGSEEMEFTILLNLQDISTGQVLLSAVTNNLIVGKGVKILKATELQPISYTYGFIDFEKSYLPFGAYIASYQLVSLSNRKETVIAEEHVRINVEPLSPPLLNSPSNKSIVQTTYPQFVWMPPTPFDIFNSLSYELIVTEVQEGQTPIEAIQYNPPIYSKNNIINTYENYASSFSKLDTGKTYAWQVIVKNDLNYVAKTEVWTFKIVPEPWVKVLIEQTPYMKMKKDNPEKAIMPNGLLKIAYDNETSDSIAIIKIKECVEKNKRNDAQFEVKVVRGENIIQKNLSELIQFKEGHLYEASITNSKNEKWQLQFEVKKYKDKKTERN